MTKNRKKGTFMMKKWNRSQSLGLGMPVALKLVEGFGIAGM